MLDDRSYEMLEKFKEFESRIEVMVFFGEKLLFLFRNGIGSWIELMDEYFL